MVNMQNLPGCVRCGVHVVVGTPGRTLDLVERGELPRAKGKRGRGAELVKN